MKTTTTAKWTLTADGKWTLDDGRRTLALVVRVGNTYDAHAWKSCASWGEPETLTEIGRLTPEGAMAAVDEHLAA